MAAKGKGKIVAQWQTSQPDEQGDDRGCKVPISLTIGDGLFHIPLQEHVTAFLGPNPEWPEHVNDRENFYRHSDREVVGKSMDAVKNYFNSVCKHYQSALRNQERRKVILVSFDSKSSDRDYYARMSARGLGRMVNTSHSSFGGPAPSLGLSYEVLWEMAGKIYRVHDRTDGALAQMTYMRAAPGQDDKRLGRDATFMLDWTADREAFFASMTAAMNTLIERIAVMLGDDVTATVDRMIAAGGGLLSLPAPEETEETTA